MALQGYIVRFQPYIEALGLFHLRRGAWGAIIDVRSELSKDGYGRK